MHDNNSGSNGNINGNVNGKSNGNCDIDCDDEIKQHEASRTHIPLPLTVLLCAVSAVGFAVFMLSVYKCPIKLLLGIDCPGCGMTRAYLSLFRLDISAAFRYHHLFPIPLLVLAYLPFRKRLKFSPRTEAIAIAVILLLFILRWILLLAVNGLN